MRRTLLFTILYFAVFLSLLFLSAGRLDWPMGWATISLYLVLSFIPLIAADPQVLEERTRMRAGVKRRDVVVSSLTALFLFSGPVLPIVAGLDAGRFRWTPPLPLAVQALALVLFALGYAFVCWAVVKNTHFETFVRIQQERQHQVITDGPYRYVRHPGYAGGIVASLAFPLALGSLWGLIPAAIGSLGLVLRTVLEEQTLLQELEGYRAYRSLVRFRLLPGVW
jgi:protein-S-isoprenylcysteine O-methyltransferase Ste14